MLARPSRLRRGLGHLFKNESKLFRKRRRPGSLGGSFPISLPLSTDMVGDLGYGEPQSLDHGMGKTCCI